MGMIGNFPAVGIVSSANLSDKAVTAPKLDTTASQLFGFRNRIMNGDMRIDQRNNGAAVTANSAYPVDRFGMQYSMDGTVSAQRVSDAPAGFVNSLKITAGTADASVGAAQYFQIFQAIEGGNVADFGWGGSSAQPGTLSFWVKASVTGLFGGAIINSDNTRTYAFQYTINATNTWEYKTIVIPGDVSGTWLKDNNAGIRVFFNLMCGSNFQAPSSAWSSTLYVAPAGQVNLFATSGNSWQITGVQLEKGTVATPFEFRSIGQELALCQRYYERPHFGAIAASRWTLLDWTGNIRFAVTKRATPTITLSGSVEVYANGVNGSTSNISVWTASAGQQLDGFGLRVGGGSNQDAAGAIFGQSAAVIQVSSEL